MKKLLFTLSVLLCVASQVSASCAWILWSNYQGPSNLLTYQFLPMGGYETKELCEKEVTATVNRELEKQGVIKPGSLLCLPDTIDPRDSKQSN